jgi:predicted alpha/beta hydrolase
LKGCVGMLNKTFGYFPGKFFRMFGDLPQGVIREWANWCDNQNGLFDSFPDNNYRKLNIPILVYTFTDDWHCPPRAVKELLNRFSSAMITWYHLNPKEIGMKKIGQNDFFLPALKSTLWENLLEWVNNEHVKTANTKPVIHKSI